MLPLLRAPRPVHAYWGWGNSTPFLKTCIGRPDPWCAATCLRPQGRRASTAAAPPGAPAAPPPTASRCAHAPRQGAAARRPAAGVGARAGVAAGCATVETAVGRRRGGGKRRNVWRTHLLLHSVSTHAARCCVCGARAVGLQASAGLAGGEQRGTCRQGCRVPVMHVEALHC